MQLSLFVDNPIYHQSAFPFILWSWRSCCLTTGDDYDAVSWLFWPWALSKSISPLNETALSHTVLVKYGSIKPEALMTWIYSTLLMEASWEGDESEIAAGEALPPCLFGLLSGDWSIWLMSRDDRSPAVWWGQTAVWLTSRMEDRPILALLSSSS